MTQYELWVVWTENGNERRNVWQSPCTMDEIKRLTQLDNPSWLDFRIQPIPDGVDRSLGIIPQRHTVANPITTDPFEEIPLMRKFGFSFEAMRLVRVLQLATGGRILRRCYCSAH